MLEANCVTNSATIEHLRGRIAQMMMQGGGNQAAGVYSEADLQGKIAEAVAEKNTQIAAHKALYERSKATNAQLVAEKQAMVEERERRVRLLL